LENYLVGWGVNESEIHFGVGKAKIHDRGLELALAVGCASLPDGEVVEQVGHEN